MIEHHLQRFGMMKRILLFCLFFIIGNASQIHAETIIECKIKGLGIRFFKLEGLFIKDVLVRKSKGDWTEWCPTNDEQTFRMGNKEAFCQVAKHRHRGMLIWGDTIVNFAKPNWQMRYRYAKPGQEYKDSQPNGRESATCLSRE